MVNFTDQLNFITFAVKFYAVNIIFRTFMRVCNLMLYPAKEWKLIAAENHSRKTVYVQYVVPLLCLITIAIITGTWLATSREKYSGAYVLRTIAIMWTSLSAGLYLSAFVINEIMAHQTGTKNHKNSFVLMAYASGAAYLVIAIVALFPFFNELIVLAFYSCYLYWQGISQLIQIEGQKKMIYGILSFIIAVLVYFLAFFFFGNVFEAMVSG